MSWAIHPQIFTKEVWAGTGVW